MDPSTVYASSSSISGSGVVFHRLAERSGSTSAVCLSSLALALGYFSLLGEIVGMILYETFGSRRFCVI